MTHETVREQIEVATTLLDMAADDGEDLVVLTLLDYMAILGVQFAPSGPDPDQQGVTLITAAYFAALNPDALDDREVDRAALLRDET